MYILEIGAGMYPWFVRQDHFSVNTAEFTPLKQEFAEIGEDHMYVCVDNSPSQARRGDAFVRNKCQDVMRGDFTYLQANGCLLPFSNESFDVVILSDVLSLPEIDWQDAKYGLQRGCTRKAKATIISEIKRVLKSGGRFIECTYQGFSNLAWSDNELESDEDFIKTLVCLRQTIVVPHTPTQQLIAREIVFTKK